MTRDEIAWRAATTLRRHAQRIGCLLRRPRWQRDAIASVLTRDVVDDALAAAIRGRDWLAVHDLLAARLRARPARFVLNPGSAATLRRQILNRWPDAATEAAARADRLLDGEIDLLGYGGLRFSNPPASGAPIDWHFDPVHAASSPMRFWADVPYLDPEHGDHKVIWELNRHQHWLALSRARWLTGDECYAAEIRRQLADWLAANPPLTGVNWASMLELGFRSISWVWALHALLVHEQPLTEPWLVDLLVGLDRQLTHVEQNLSYYFSPNTHLLGEALALYVAGEALPELANAARWRATGRRVLMNEIAKQIAADGGHAERSTHYHRYTLDFYMLALLTARQAGDADAEAAFRDAVERLAVFLHAMADSDGRTPQIGDDDGGSLWPIARRDPKDVRDTLALAAVVLDRPELASWGVPEEVFWLAWHTHPENVQALWSASSQLAAARDRVAGLDTHVFPDTGYVVLRDPAGSHVVFDVGPHGFLNGGHAHTDPLAVTVAVNGHSLLIDPGTATYVMDPALRDRMRSSVSHNTLTLDGQPPSMPSGPFHWRSRADARLDTWRGNPGFGWAEGSHEGYPGACHRRSIVQMPGGGTLIVDQVGGHERHSAQLHWHFDPRWEVASDGARRLRARHADGAIAWMVRDGGTIWLANGDEEAGIGWYSPAYGALVPTWAARVTRNGVAPFSMVTWIGTGHYPPSLERLPAEADPTGHALAVRVTQHGVTWLTILRPGEPPSRATRSCSAGGYHTNARLLQHAMQDNAVVSLNLADGTYALSQHDGAISVAADDYMTDLHLSLTGDTLELAASRPPARLHLQGAALERVRRARLNGRELPVVLHGRSDSLIVTGSAWSAQPVTIAA